MKDEGSNLGLNFLELFEQFFHSFDLSEHFGILGQGFFLVFVQFFAALRFTFVTFQFFLEELLLSLVSRMTSSPLTFRLPRFRCFFSRARIAWVMPSRFVAASVKGPDDEGGGVDFPWTGVAC